MVIDNTGKVGIGTTSPSVNLHIFATGAPTLRIQDADGTTQYTNILQSNGLTTFEGRDGTGDGAFRFRGASTLNEYLRIDSSGRLLVGTSTNIGTEADNRDTLNLVSASGGSLLLGRNDTGVAASNDIGRISFWGNDSDGTYEQCAEIHVEADLPHATGDKPSRMVFSTTAAGASSPTERMRIDRSGRLLVGTVTEGPGDADNLTIADSGNCGITIRSGTTNLGSIFFSDGTSGSAEYDGFIEYSQNSSSMRFGTTSVERMRIDSSGRLLVGTSSDITGAPANSISLVDTNSRPIFAIGRDDSTVAADVVIADIRFYGTGGDGSTWEECASIKAEADGTHATGDKPSRLVFATTADSASSSTERMRIDSSGNVGIGTTSPDSLLHVSGGVPRIQLTDTDTGVDHLINANSSVGVLEIECDINAEGSSPSIRFGVGGLERARIDSSGRLLVGASSARSNLFNSTVAVPFQVEGTGTSSAGISVIANPGAVAEDSAVVVLGKSRGSSVGGTTIVASDDELGVLSYQGSDGSEFVEGARISCEVDGTPGANDMPGRLVFSTTADGASSPTERMRIASDGALYVQDVYDTTTVNAANVEVNSNGRLRRSTSSAKYKTNVQTLEDSYADAILNCRPVWYQSLCNGDNPDHGHWGFIAEEVAEIDPRLVFWKTVNISHDENGSPVETPCDPEPEGVAYDRFVPHLLNLIKRQQQAIETLEAKVAALEAG